MRNLRSLLLVMGGMVLGACATQTFRPDEAPEYVVTGAPAPFYLGKPGRKSVPDASLDAQTRVKLLRKQSKYSLVQLEDSRTGYVANASITPAPPGSEQRPFDSPPESEPPPPERKKRLPASPTPTPSQPLETPAPETSAPATSPPASPDSQAPPEQVPSPTPAPEAPIEKPKFRL